MERIISFYVMQTFVLYTVFTSSSHHWGLALLATLPQIHDQDAHGFFTAMAF